MIIVETTQLSTAKQRRKTNWVKFRDSRNITTDAIWVFTDGSSTGWYAAAVVDRASRTALKLCQFSKKTHTRNVGAELNGLILGLRHAPENKTVYVVHDYLGVGAWMTENWKINDDEVRQKINEAKTVAKARNLTVRFVHHAGHQTDKSSFTRWNRVVDELCSAQEETIREEHLEDV